MGFQIPPILLALAAALLVIAPFALLAGRRGGRHRALPGWIGSWVIFAALLVCLSRTSRWISFPILGATMFAALRQYFFVAPLRPRDRLAILAAYAAIPFLLWPAFLRSYAGLLSAAVLGLLLVFPVLLATGPRRPGLLDSAGRVLLGFLLFVVCLAHLGLMADDPRGLLELFGVLAVGAELPQRLAGRGRPGEPVLHPLLGVLASIAVAVGLGARLAPLAGIAAWHGGWAGLVVALAATSGAIVADAVAQDLGIAGPPSLTGRGVFLDRAMPAVYAAPVFYLYLRAFV